MKTIKPDLKTPLVLSLGDPAGIGPEIIAKAWLALRHMSNIAFCVIGDAGLLAAQGVDVVRVSSADARSFATALPVLDRPLSLPAVAGTPDSGNAPNIIDAIRQGVDLCLGGQARALVTAPIAKSVLYASGFAFPGHTEYLAELCKAANDGAAPQPVMMLTAPDKANNSDLRVVLATIHVPLAEVSAQLSRTHLTALARITRQALIRDFAIAAPRLVMAGLNPHAGEDGTIGKEDMTILRPAIIDLQNEMDISGPYPADSLFHDEARRRYDAVLCMYHDQGLIPLKALDFWGGVNITLGLPIVRTSPDHGTGFDIAGKGIARADSLIAAIHAADRISRNRASA